MGNRVFTLHEWLIFAGSMKVNTLNTPCMDAMDNHGGMYIMSCRTLNVINNTQKNTTCVNSQNEQIPETHILLLGGSSHLVSG